MQTRVLDNIGHSGTKAEGYARGMIWVFNRPSLKLPDAVLSNYAGKYQVGNDTLQLVVESGKLMVVVPGNYKFELQAASENDFYINGQFTRAHFKKDESGKIPGFTLEQFEGSQFVKRISN